ncbi:LPXTG cell wall anchor domain-containing protein [Pseudozobellia sp. WGM2]|uniref:LPXTG cell wall anchor domain-containing protein n=1 Tax=Pseudozobellia sp. WGM2 TaxID=2787625 RepID=UPI001ADF7211|nr:LPXTG cell wall anchor domain-containing protein [Pseudozobellia sp. WGM2]
MDWIIENKDWLFSGLGISIIGFGYYLIRRKKRNKEQMQKGGKNSTNLQAGGDININ